MIRCAGVIVASVVATAVHADVIVAPNANTAVAGNGGLNTLVRDANNPRTYQAQIAASELAPMLGQQITGIAFRLQPSAANATSWPATAATWANYDITMAQAANSIAGMSTTYADNMLNPMVVRSGPLTIAPNSFPGGVTAPPAVNDFGVVINFSAPYTYTGGDLVFMVSHTGSDLANNRFLDSITTTGPGYGTTVRALNNTTYQGTAGAFGSFTIAQFTYVPAPGTLAMLGLAGLAAARRRR